MREVEFSGPHSRLDTASFLACVATILELPLERLPQPGATEDAAKGWVLSRWLGSLGLGLAQLADPARFAWAGPWIARLRSPGQEGLRSVVMYGVPSGVVWDPTGISEGAGWEIEDGFLIAATDIALALPPLPQAPAGSGLVEEIWIAASAGEPLHSLASAGALPGKGLAGDRHALGTGTFPSDLPGSALTLIEAETCESFAPALRPGEHRRNLVTRGIDLNALVGHEFVIGSARCRGVRLCEPCNVLEGYAPRPVLRALVHRGGLRADVLDGGTIAVGDRIQAREG